MLQHGSETIAFQGLGPEFHHWFDVETDACVAYVDTGGAWVAAGGPLCADDQRARAAERFVAAASAAKRRACFFGVEHPSELGPGFGAVLLGENAEIDPTRWAETLAAHRGLREQLRRARAKGVRVRRVDPAELEPGTPLRATVDSLASAWLAARHLEPMGFVVAVAPHELANDRRYYAAEHAGRVVAFAWLVPIPARQGWLVEHMVRSSGRAAPPNGTTELLLDAAIRDAAGAAVVSLGLAPLSGSVAWSLRVARTIASPLYDFRSLRSFKLRMHPDRWERAWLVHPRRRAGCSMVDALRAFARGSLLRFAAHSLVRHPSGLPWLLAVPLMAWTSFLGMIAALDDGSLLGFSRPALVAWIAWDAALAWLLFRTARRPRRNSLGWLAVAAATDATLSIAHVTGVGLGAGLDAQGLRVLATIAPILGTLALTWAATRASVRTG